MNTKLDVHCGIVTFCLPKLNHLTVRDFAPGLFVVGTVGKGG